MVIDINKVIKKWGPVFESAFDIKNKYIIKLLSIYSETYNINNPETTDLPEKLKNIMDKLKSKVKPLKIDDIYYNLITCSIEYRLENGTILDKNLQFIEELSFDDMIYLFGVDFVRDLDVEDFRNKRLNDILKDVN